MNTLIRTTAALTLLISPTAALADSPLDSAPGFAMSVGAGSSVGSAELPGLSLNNRIGVSLSKMVLFASFDMLSASYEIDSAAGSASLTTLGAGGRYFLKPLRLQKATPYIAAELFTVIPRTNIDNGTDSFVEKVKSFGVLGAFGGEYAFAESASVGGELGLSQWIGAYSESNVDASAKVMGVNSSIFLNFYF